MKTDRPTKKKRIPIQPEFLRSIVVVALRPKIKQFSYSFNVKSYPSPPATVGDGALRPASISAGESESTRRGEERRGAGRGGEGGQRARLGRQPLAQTLSATATTWVASSEPIRPGEAMAAVRAGEAHQGVQVRGRVARSTIVLILAVCLAICLAASAADAWTHPTGQ